MGMRLIPLFSAHGANFAWGILSKRYRFYEFGKSIPTATKYSNYNTSVSPWLHLRSWDAPSSMQPSSHTVFRIWLAFFISHPPSFSRPFWNIQNLSGISLLGKSWRFGPFLSFINRLMDPGLCLAIITVPHAFTAQSNFTFLHRGACYFCSCNIKKTWTGDNSGHQYDIHLNVYCTAIHTKHLHGNHPWVMSYFVIVIRPSFRYYFYVGKLFLYSGLTYICSKSTANGQI